MAGRSSAAQKEQTFVVNNGCVSSVAKESFKARLQCLPHVVGRATRIGPNRTPDARNSLP